MNRLDSRARASGHLKALMLGGLAAGFVALSSSDAFAQANTLVPFLDGNDAQEDAARLVDDTCPELVRPGNSLPQTQLVTVCSNMIVDILQANADNLSDFQAGLLQILLDEGFTGYGLGAEETGNILQALNGEEIQAAQSRVGEVRAGQEQQIYSRLSAIRAGKAGGGLSLANLNLETGDQIYAASELTGFDQSRYEILPAAWLNDETWSRLGFFFSGGVTVGDKEATGQSDGFDFHSLNLTFGGDYRVTDSLVVGAALGYNRFDSDVDTTDRSPAGEDLGSDGHLISVFASHNWDWGLFVDGVASYGRDEYDSTRRIVIQSQNADQDSIDETASGNFDSEHYGVAANLGYQFETSGVTVTPVAKLEYVNAQFDGFTESGANGLNLTFDDFDAESLRGQLGVEASYSISTDQGVLVPSLRAEYIHEFSNDDDGAQIVFANGVDRGAVVDITTEDVDRDYGVIGASLTAVGEGGMSAFVDYSTVVALDDFDVHQIKAGVRWEF